MASKTTQQLLNDEIEARIENLRAQTRALDASTAVAEAQAAHLSAQTRSEYGK